MSAARRPTPGSPPPLPPTGIVPAPPANISLLNPLIETWPLGTVMYRGHWSGPHGCRFNPHYGNPTRFAFFRDASGNNVPVLYAGKTIEVAIAETLFHDLPRVTGATLLADKYRDVSYSKVLSTRALRLAVLHSDGLRRLNLQNHQIIDTDAIEYPDTVKWAQALHARVDLGIDGLTWMSRQFNLEKSAVLFGDRVSAHDLELDPDEQDIPFGVGKGLGKLLIAAGDAGVWVQTPKAPFLS